MKDDPVNRQVMEYIMPYHSTSCHISQLKGCVPSRSLPVRLKLDIIEGSRRRLTDDQSITNHVS
ncbi:MAG: hypothetical protein WA398_08740 [Nitrososphaeraceae archaeon]|jgi:hypothetical protein